MIERKIHRDSPRTSTTSRWLGSGILALALGAGSACSGGLKAGGSLKVDSKTGFDAKLDAKTTAKAKSEPKEEKSKPRPADEALDDALAGSHRSPEHRARDKYRHPKETMLFFGLKSDMTVLEVEPGSDAWYPEVLAPVLRQHGKLLVTNFDVNGPEGAPITRSAKALADKLAADPNVYDKVEVVTLTKEYKLGEPNSVDMVVSFRNSHLWKQDKIEKRVYNAMFEVLKPGGTLGIVQHRACAGDRASRTFPKGYLPQPYVIETIEEAGFVFEEESHINANSFDTRDYPKGVWTLPPVLARGETDREKYEKIGESDRMTLRFRKPASSAPAEPPEASPEETSPAPPSPPEETAPADSATPSEDAAEPSGEPAPKPSAASTP